MLGVGRARVVFALAPLLLGTMKGKERESTTATIVKAVAVYSHDWKEARLFHVSFLSRCNNANGIDSSSLA